MTLNEYTIKDSFLLAEELLNYDSNLVMTRFDVEPLFTNIPLQETIDLCVKLLFNDKHNIDGFTITDFHVLLTVTMYESLVLCDGKYYKEIDGVAMGSRTNVCQYVSFLIFKFHSKIVRVNLNLSFRKYMLMTPSCYFDQKIILRNSMLP